MAFSDGSLKFVEIFRKHAQGKGKILDILNEAPGFFISQLDHVEGHGTPRRFFPLKALEPLSLIMRQLSLKLDSDSDLRRWELESLSFVDVCRFIFWGVFQVDHKLRSLLSFLECLPFPCNRP